MKTLYNFIALLSTALLFVACDKKSESSEQTILKGEARVLVDETLFPILEDQARVFESDYPAQIHLIAKSENEVIQALVNDTAQIAVLARNLTEAELKYFQTNKRFPKITPIAKDAIALVSQKGQDSTVVLKEVLDFLKNGSSKNFTGLVFDNLNSSTLLYLQELAGVKTIPNEGVYSFKTNAEVLQFVAENPKMIGVVGINWIVQPTEEVKNYLNNIQVLYVKGLDQQGFFAPTQNNLAEGTYSLARQLYFVNAQGFDGLGMGFSSFVAGERGQRIFLKSGLLPERIPHRKIVVKKTL